MYFIEVYLFSFRNEVGVFWKSFEEYSNIFHLRSYLLKSIQKLKNLRTFVENSYVHMETFAVFYYTKYFNCGINYIHA